MKTVRSAPEMKIFYQGGVEDRLGSNYSSQHYSLIGRFSYWNNADLALAFLKNKPKVRNTEVQKIDSQIGCQTPILLRVRNLQKGQG